MKKDFQEFSLGIHVGQMEPGSVSSADFEGQSAVCLFPGSFPKLWTAGVDATLGPGQEHSSLAVLVPDP